MKYIQYEIATGVITGSTNVPVDDMVLLDIGRMQIAVDDSVGEEQIAVDISLGVPLIVPLGE